MSITQNRLFSLPNELINLIYEFLGNDNQREFFKYNFKLYYKLYMHIKDNSSENNNIKFNIKSFDDEIRCKINYENNNIKLSFYLFNKYEFYDYKITQLYNNIFYYIENKLLFFDDIFKDKYYEGGYNDQYNIIKDKYKKLIHKYIANDDCKLYKYLDNVYIINQYEELLLNRFLSYEELDNNYYLVLIKKE